MLLVYRQFTFIPCWQDWVLNIMGAQDPKLITCKPWGKSVLGRISVEPLTTGRKEDVSVIAEIAVHHGIFLCVTCERHWVNSVKMISGLQLSFSWNMNFHGFLLNRTIYLDTICKIDISYQRLKFVFQYRFLLFILLQKVESQLTFRVKGKDFLFNFVRINAWITIT